MGLSNHPHHIAAVSQRRAAYPHHSVWVAASAGSGKTKVLTDRVLNLLLEGGQPERLLCLTFTKAAAAEMANRLRARLGEWAILPEDTLRASLSELVGTEISLEKIERARKLFGLTLDTPGGLKIQTIHSFCQSLLKRFPLEAGISPFFTVMDEGEQQKLIQEAFYEVMEDPLFHALILRFSEATFQELNSFILQKRDNFPGKIPPLPPEHNDTLEIPEEQIRSLLSLFEKGSPTDQARGLELAAFLARPPEERAARSHDYISLFLTRLGQKRARLLTQALAKESPSLKTFLEEEAKRLEGWVERQKIAEVMRVSHFLSLYSHRFLETYDALKTAGSLVDYEDLILKTLALLRNPGCHWVLYKLDGGLDHILLDEAQDTSPSQWKVVRAIAEEFYANAATDSRNRTLFIVGDSKQSIYSFQGVDPLVFSEMQKDLHAFATQSEKKWENIDLNVSFRSTPEILALVNTVFPSFPTHLPFRENARGHVEVWPLIKEDEDSTLEPWQLPLVSVSKESPQKRLACKIASSIQECLETAGPLSRPVKPGDILILVRRRTAFVEIMIRALKERNIPVAGVDRLALMTGLGVQDLVKLGEFFLLPEDDLTLATVLKGPLFHLEESDLFQLSYNRSPLSLWECLQKETRFSEGVRILQDLLAQSLQLTPFALYSYILGPLGGRKKWQAHLGSDVLESLDEFLSLCLSFQESHVPSLQGFLWWLSQENSELKRDLEESNQVRVMTVHGSKGLQAPIVFLPDTTQVPVDLPLFGFHDEALVWLPPAEKDIPLTKAIKEELRTAQREEYWRLLYVALTRAADALYICGWEGQSQDSWYSRIESAIQKIGTQDEEIWRLSSLLPQQHSSGDIYQVPPFLLPQWLQTPVAPEKSPRVLSPSKSEEDAHLPSLFGAWGRERGILIHRLLELLPLTPLEKREEAALAYLEKEKISTATAKEMVTSIQKVLTTYPDIFGPSSQAEVPVMGYLGESVLSGQIDRLLVDSDHILIVDFKTHGVVPKNLIDIPRAYLQQLGLYHGALSQVYPDRAITCALLWTEAPRLDTLPFSLIEEFSCSFKFPHKVFPPLSMAN